MPEESQAEPITDEGTETLVDRFGRTGEPLTRSDILRLKSKDTVRVADQLTGYDLRDTGELVWGDE